MKVALWFLPALLIASPLAAQETRAELPGWMAGCWEMRDGERWAEECWTVPRGGMMMGSGRTGVGDTVRNWEFMRIAADEPNGDGPVLRMAFAASPGGRGWTTFGWSPSAEEGVTFFNAANDFPQRVRYWLEDGKLNAEIALEDGGNAMRWTFSRMGG